MKTRKELKEAYKQMKFRIGVFQIRNIANGKIFLDSSVNLDAIWNRNLMQLNWGKHPNVQLQKDWNTYGADNFRFEVLTEIEQKESESVDYHKEIKTLEAMYREELMPFDERGYHGIAK